MDKKHGAGLQNVEMLLNAIDRSEIDANAQTGLSLIASLPKLLTDEDRARIVRDFGREEFLRHNIPAVAHIHGPQVRGKTHDDRQKEETTMRKLAMLVPILLSSFALLSTAGTLSAQKLVSAEIRFDTLGNDKDHDTYANVEVLRSDGYIQHRPRHSVSGL